MNNVNNVNRVSNSQSTAQIELATLTAPGVASSTPEDTTVKRNPGNKTFLTTAPTLTTPGQEKKGHSSINQLFEYLTEIMLVQVAISSDESKLNISTTGLSSDMVNLLQDTMKEFRNSLYSF